MAFLEVCPSRDRRRCLAVAVLLAVSATACGNRLDEKRLAADAARENGAQGASEQQASDGGAQAGASDSATTPAGGTDAALPGPGAVDTTPSTATPAAPPTGSGTPGSAAAVLPSPGPGPAKAARANTGPARAGGGAGTKPAAPAPGSGAGGTGGTAGPAAPPSGGGAPQSGGAPPGGGTVAPGGGQPAPSAGGPCAGPKAPIVIGSVGEYSGLLGPVEGPGVKSVQAWVAATNAQGGLKCHPVKYVVYDTGGDPARHQSLTQRAVEQDGAIAFVYNGAALSGQASTNYLEQRRIPVIGEEGAQPWVCYGKMGFPIMSSCAEGIQGIYQVLAKVIKPGKQVAAITCSEVPFCTGYSNNAKKYAEEAGFELVYNGNVTLTQPDYTSACVQAKNAGAEALALGMIGDAASRLQRSCKSVGLDVPFISNGTAFSSSTNDPGMVGAWIASGVRFTPVNHPAVSQWLAAMKQYVPGVQPSANGGIGWVAAKVFEQAAQNMPDVPTSEAVLEGLWSIKGNDFGGLTRPLTYVKDQPAQQTPACWFAVQLEKGGWAGDTRICL